MHNGRAAIVATLVLAFGLGTVATVAIRRASGRRAVLAEEVAGRFPALPQSRLVAPWVPAMDADQTHATYCLDDARTPGDAAARFAAALTAAGWKVSAGRPDAPGAAIGMELLGWGYRLRGVTGPGTRADCDGTRRQMALTVEAARIVTAE